MQLDRQPRFGRLVAHRIRSDQRSRFAGRIGHTISLAVVLINPVTREQRRSRSDLRYRLYEEEIVSHDVEAVAERMLHAVEEIVDYGFAVYPMVVVTRADRESRGCGPID